jgi:hypothetical protein
MAFAQSDSALTFSEVMFNPTSGNNEFIEIYNTSQTQSIDLNNYRIKYYTSIPDTIKNAGFGSVLPPMSYAIIFESDYDFASGIYLQLIPPGALKMKISDNAFGSSGMANTTDRQLWIINTNGDTLETYTYSSSNGTAISDEKIIMIKNNSSSNWGNSLTSNGTPGFKNSISPLLLDLELQSVSIAPTAPLQGETVTITSTIKNKGTTTALTFQLQVYNDANFDSIAAANELISLQNIFSLNAGDSTKAFAQLGPLNSGSYQLISKVVFSGDEDTANNKKIFKFTVQPPLSNYNDVVINEIMYAPISGEPEWIEIYNRTNSPINLKKWKLADNSTTTTITNNNVTIPARSFLVLSKDSTILNFYSVPAQIVVLSLPALNNTDDAVVIKDSLGTLVDSLYYLSSWGGSSGKSLERIDVNTSSTQQSNWKTSTSIYRATPGRINSVTQKDHDLWLKEIVFNPAAPVSGENVTISALVKNIGKNSEQYSLQLFEDTNLDSIPDNLIAVLTALSLASGDSVIQSFSFTIQNINTTKGFTAQAVLVQDEDSSNNKAYKQISPGFPPQSIVINEIMFSPAGGEPEWIEVYNTTNDSINLKNWIISDVFTTPAVAKINYDVYISGKSFLTIARDSSIKNYHRSIPSKMVVVNLPVLNNDVDGVVLKDNRSAVIDSVLYSSLWGGTSGYSLERKQYNLSSLLQNNWSSSLDIELSTPGRVNSISPKNYDLTISEISFQPRYPIPGDDVIISAKIKNNGVAQAQNFSVSFLFDSDNNNKVDSLLEMKSNLNLAAGDSLILLSANPLKNLSSKILAAIQIDFAQDEDLFNNYGENSIEPGFAQKSLVINEVMYDPINGEPEWIEIQNTSSTSLNLKNWSISDLYSTPTKAFIDYQDLVLLPNEFLIIAKDTSVKNFHPHINCIIKAVNFGSLNSSGDGIFIYDFRNAIIDSVVYKSSWGGQKGSSIERISKEKFSNDSSNWVTSLSMHRSTPGSSNSVLNIPNYKINDIVINEILFDPELDNSEFVEFYNLSNDSINLGGWKIYDEKGNFYKLIETGLLLPPNEYFILIADSLAIKKYSHLNVHQYKNIINESSIGLTNSGELVLLKDIRGNTIDSVWYTDKWHNKNIITTKNKSLERINPILSSNEIFNWSTSVSPEGSTPAKVNSIYTSNSNLLSNISVSPNPFSPDNDGFEDFTIINYSLSQPISQVRIKIFDSKGRLVRTLANNQASGSQGSIIFNGLDDDGNSLRIGIYIILLEAINSNNGSIDKLKTVVVVARKL